MFEPFSLYAVGPKHLTAAARSAAVVLLPLLADTSAVVRLRARRRSAFESTLRATVPPTTPPCPRRASREAVAAARPTASAARVLGGRGGRFRGVGGGVLNVGAETTPRRTADLVQNRRAPVGARLHGPGEG